MDEDFNVSLLANGISPNGFEKIYADIYNAVIVECISKINDCGAILEEVKKVSNTEETNKNIATFHNTLVHVNEKLNIEVQGIRDLLDRIFNDWDEYKSGLENNSKVENSEIVEEGESNE